MARLLLGCWARMLVSWLFLGLSCWGALFTLNALFPQRHALVRVVLSFFNAWLTTELALHHLVGQLIVTVGFAAAGAFSYWPGQVGAGVTVLSWVGLISLVREAHRDQVVIDAALSDGLGPDYDAAIDEDLRRDLREPLNWRRLAWPFRMRRREVIRLRDVPYTETGQRRHRLDVYKRRDLQPGAPVLLQIHGGAWVVGDKGTQGLPLLYQMAERGWLCVAINYGLSPRATWPDHLVDCKRALAWIRESAEHYQGDPDFVVVTGGSAGGHLASMVALTPNDPDFQPDFPEVDTRVQGFVPFYGVYDWTDRHQHRGERDLLRGRLESVIIKEPRDEAFEAFHRGSPLSHCNGDIPPAMVVHGEKDNLAPVAEARDFVEALREASEQPVVYVELAGAHHAFDVFSSLRTMHVLRGVEAFTGWVDFRDRTKA